MSGIGSFHSFRDECSPVMLSHDALVARLAVLASKERAATRTGAQKRGSSPDTQDRADNSVDQRAIPHANGGPATTMNIELRCRSHNAHEATRYFGVLPLTGE